MPYGDDMVDVVVDADCTVVAPGTIDGIDARGAIGQALCTPVGQPPLSKFLAGANDLLVVVNDATRATPTAAVLEAVWPAISGVEEVTFMVATGAHGPPDRSGLEGIFGDLLPEVRGRLAVHDADDDAGHVRLGETTRGTPVLIDRRAVEASRILLIGSVQPHYFAGLSGGRKGLAIGLAGRATIEANHSLALQEGVASLALDGNPVHEDMVEIVGFMDGRRITTVQVVLDAERRVIEASAGDLHGAFGRAAETARRLFGVPVEGRFDVIVTCVPPPKDLNMYQSQHALEHAAAALADGGIVIWVSACRRGVGDDRFLRLLHDANGVADVEASLAGGYRLSDHKAHLICRTLERADIWTVMGVDDEAVYGARMMPFADIQEAVGAALAVMRERGREPRVLVMPDGTSTVPTVGGE
ncbi:MAG: nickel-dependent lactate racemase [Thermoplasmata archaeon]|nr:nickel-dependent lactate racemase [Thermoplasmata archaeon]